MSGTEGRRHYMSSAARRPDRYRRQRRVATDQPLGAIRVAALGENRARRQGLGHGDQCCPLRTSLACGRADAHDHLSAAQCGSQHRKQREEDEHSEIHRTLPQSGMSRPVRDGQPTEQPACKAIPRPSDLVAHVSLGCSRTEPSLSRRTGLRAPDVDPALYPARLRRRLATAARVSWTQVTPGDGLARWPFRLLRIKRLGFESLRARHARSMLWRRLDEGAERRCHEYPGGRTP